MTDDYPCSHSMDSYWFAVDKDGRVGYFSTGEAGAMPDNAGDATDILRRLTELVPPGPAVFELEGRILPHGGDEARRRHLVWFRDESWVLPSSVLMFLESAEPVRDLIGHGNSREVAATTGAAVILERMPADRYRELHNDSRCLGCFSYWTSYYDVEGEARPAGLGLYEYDHLCENWIAGPYGLELRPARPLHIDQLPPDIRRAIGRVRFATMNFAQTPHIQPLEYVSGSAWGDTYQTVDGRQLHMDGTPIEGSDDDEG
jgi:hypothetical protein